MTFSQLLKKGIGLLREASIDNSENEARWILETVFDVGIEFLIFHFEDEADESKADIYLEKIRERLQGIPVQYIVGFWDFYGESFEVGKGVLIPRPETELLVDFALSYLKDIENPVVYDLCSGSGCIGLSVAKNVPDSQVFLIEKSPEAFSYLEKNVRRLGCGNVKAICGDIFCGADSFDLPKPHLILSNPPYIETSDIAGLQSEVHFEPVMALDGGADGYDFYRAIGEKWLGSADAVAVECGEGQAETIKEIFSHKFAGVYAVRDFNGIERAVIGKERI